MASSIWRFLRWPIGEQTALVVAVLMLHRTAVLLRRTDVAAVSRRLRSAAGACYTIGMLPSTEGVIVKAVARASRLVPKARCLAQAVVAQAMMEEAGMATTLRLGVAKGPDSQLEAHAWLERDGRAIVGAVQLARYSTLSRPATTIHGHGRDADSVRILMDVRPTLGK